MKESSYIVSLILLLSIIFSSVAQAQDKKWSPQAKGAVIGGLGGAAAGAIIHKRNRAVGGVVGGVVGGGAGYAVGKHIDNKNKAKAAQAEAARQAAYRASANRAAVAQRNASTKTNKAYKASATAAAPAMALTTSTAVTAQGYLPNDAAGDPSHPYADSEYKRKSW